MLNSFSFSFLTNWSALPEFYSMKQSVSFNLRNQDNHQAVLNSGRPDHLAQCEVWKLLHFAGMEPNSNTQNPELLISWKYHLRVLPDDSMKVHLQLLSTKFRQLRNSQQKSKWFVFGLEGWVCLTMLIYLYSGRDIPANSSLLTKC